MDERNDEPRAGRPEPDEPTSEAPATEPHPQPAEPTTEAPTPSHQPAPGGQPGGDPPRGDPPADVHDGGAAVPERPRRLYRSRRDRVIAGVCGGVADYFGIEAVIVRVVAVMLVFAGGAGIFL